MDTLLEERGHIAQLANQKKASAGGGRVTRRLTADCRAAFTQDTWWYSICLNPSLPRALSPRSIARRRIWRTIGNFRFVPKWDLNYAQRCPR
jgi:hypothetical protein